MEWGVVSYIIRYYFNPCGTGSHLYSANTNTLRSDRGAEVLLALVGIRSLGRLALPFCTLIVSHFKGFVKREFFFLRTFFTRCTSSPILVSLAGTSLLTMIVYHRPHQKSRTFSKNFQLAPANSAPGQNG